MYVVVVGRIRGSGAKSSCAEVRTRSNTGKSKEWRRPERRIVKAEQIGGGCLFQEVKWEPGTTRNHKTFHAQAAQRPPQEKIKVGRGRLLNRSIRTGRLEK